MTGDEDMLAGLGVRQLGEWTVNGQQELPYVDSAVCPARSPATPPRYMETVELPADDVRAVRG